MRSIKNQIIYINYEDKINDRNNKLLLQDILQFKEDIKNKKFKGIFISLKDLNYALDDVKQLVHKLNTISKQLHIKIGLGEYKIDLYALLVNETKSTNIKLYKDANIAQLFLNPKSFTKQLKVLIFDDGNEENMEKLSHTLTAYEHIVFYASNGNDFKEKVEKNNIDFAVSQTIINSDEIELESEKDKQDKQAKFLLSRGLVSHLSLFIDTAVDSLVTITKLEAKKVSHGIRTFNPKLPEHIIGSTMHFQGELDGDFILIFPKELAIKAIEAMVGGSINKNNVAEIADGIGEFCNIITGSIKTALSKNNIKVLFDLPKTFTSIVQLKNLVSQNRGIWIDMQLSGQPFYIFIVK